VASRSTASSTSRATAARRRSTTSSVDPFRLRGQGVTLSRSMTAIGNANQNVGGQRLFIGEQSYDIRGIGLVKNVHDIENVVVAEQKGIPVRVRDVATSRSAIAPRLGIVGHDDDPDVVQGIVLMRYGGETPTRLEGVHKKVELHPQVPPAPAGHGSRPVLRPRRAREAHDAHGAREPPRRDGARRRSSCSSSSGTRAPRSSRRSTSPSRSSSRSSAWSRRARRRTSSRSARSTSASSSTPPSS
jgi:hypothetical protein